MDSDTAAIDMFEYLTENSTDLDRNGNIIQKVRQNMKYLKIKRRM